MFCGEDALLVPLAGWSVSASDSSIREIFSQLGLCLLLKMKLVSFNSLAKDYSHCLAPFPEN